MITSHQHPLSTECQSHIPFGPPSSFIKANTLIHGLHSSSGAPITSLHALPSSLSCLAIENCTPNLLSTVSCLRGGATTTAVVLDMAKEDQHLAVLASYSVLTVLVLNSALRIYTSTKFKRDRSKQYNWILPSLFALSSGICVLTGAFTGIMFQLLAIYSRSALGMGNDAGYAAFKASTLVYRRLGFNTFLWCLGSFVSMFLISLRNMTNEDERLGNGIFSAMAVLALLGGIIMKKLLNLATELIFAPMMSP